MKIDSNLVKKLRMAKNWSQEQLSEEAGLSLRTIQRLENGDNASIESIRALAAVFEIDPNELIFSEDDVAMTPFDAVKIGLLEFGNFSGTASRFEYWWFFCFVVLLMAIATVIHEKAYIVVSLILLVPFIAAGNRRLHDVGYSGWWQLFYLAPFGQIVVLILLAQESNAHPKLKNGFDAA
jgi:transcriptional regulator with XRE-family HTH domain